MSSSALCRASWIGALCLFSSIGAADDISRTDGTTIEDVTIQEESLTEITYRQGRNDRRVPTEDVLSVTYTNKPDEIDEADSYVLEGSYEDALDLYDAWVEGFLEGRNQRRHKWSPAYAAWQAVQINMTLGDLDGVVSAATRIIERLPDSRFVPQAFLARANALSWQGKGDNAQASLQAFATLIEERGLSRRWDLECRLALVLTDSSTTGSRRREALEDLQGEAGRSFPTVANRARVAVGESYLDRIEQERDADRRARKIASAREVFEEILDDFKADEQTLAGAFTGLGDCMFFEAMVNQDSPDEAGLRSALHNYLRVGVLYPEEIRYLPRAIYSAGLCFDKLGEYPRAGKLWRSVVRDFPGSEWAAQAEQKLRGG